MRAQIDMMKITGFLNKINMEQLHNIYAEFAAFFSIHYICSMKHHLNRYIEIQQ